MKISINSLTSFNKRYKSSNLNLKGDVNDLLEKIGAQLGAVEDVKYVGDKYKGILIVKVVSIEPHPDADKLKICKIDDNHTNNDVERGSDGLIQVVCGAPNVKEGMLAAWVPVGNVVPETASKEPFKLTSREIRGVISNGMLASARELDLGDSHDGLLAIDADQTIGQEFGEAYDLNDDVIIDLENKMFTHRPDCFGHMGINREIAGIYEIPFKSPDWYKSNSTISVQTDDSFSLRVTNEIPSLVPRFSAIVIKNIEIKPSPVWLQVELSKVGLRSVNNIVDLTNYYMLETGQPLHAYDYDKVKELSETDSPEIVIRNPKPDEQIKLLNGKTVKPRPQAIMIATDKQLLGIGGVMGGSESEVDPSTENIIIESASFDMYSIRRTSMENGLFTDAVTRFTKGPSPLQTVAVLGKITEAVLKAAGGEIASSVIDNSHIDESVLNRNSLHPPVKITAEFINQRLGFTMRNEEIKSLLENVEFSVEITEEGLIITAPFWRTDIELREDVVEEVGRLYGYDKLPKTLPKRDLTPTKRNPLLNIKSDIRNKLSLSGANEVLTYSFVHGDLFTKVGQDKEQAFEISNALSPDLQYYRLSLMPSLLDKVHPNIKAGYDQFALFELGKTHSLDQIDDEGLPIEGEFTALVVAAADKLKIESSAFYLARKYLISLSGEDVSFTPIDKNVTNNQLIRPYEPNRSAMISVKSSGEFLGVIGEFKASVIRNLKLPKFSAGFEVDTVALQKLIDKRTHYSQLPKFPKLFQDITLKVRASTKFSDVFDALNGELNNLKPDNTVIELSAIDIYEPDSDVSSKNITLRLEIASYERTLTDNEVNKLLDEASESVKESLQSERI